MNPSLTRAQTNPRPLPTASHVRRPSCQRSRSAPEDNELRPVVTAHFLDDYGAHHYHSDEDEAEITPISDEEKQDGHSLSGAHSAESDDQDGHSLSGAHSAESDDQDADQERGRTRLTREKSTRSRRSSRSKDPFLVTWDGDDDMDNPKNWAFKTKWAATAIVSVFTFISPVSSSMSAPALPQIGRDLHVSDPTVLSLTISIFVLAYAIGPLFLGPLSEIYGRRPVLQLSNLFFLAWNIGCGFATSPGQLIAFRFLSGLGGSAPLAIGGGILSDCWSAEQRGQAVGLYSLMPLLGPAVGPVAGGWIAEKSTWRWCFWSTSLLTVGVQGVGWWGLRETFAPVILGRRAKGRRRESGEVRWRTEWEVKADGEGGNGVGRVLGRSLGRPFRLLGTQLVIQVLAVYMAFVYGLVYLVLTTFPGVWEGVYGQSVGIGGLNYISLGIGFFIGAQTVARMNDYLYRRLKEKNGGKGRPEFRAPMILPGAILVPAGLFMYGWGAEAHAHWIVPNIGAVLFAAGTIASFQCVQTYIVDSYPTYAASAVAAVTVLRSLGGFGFPLFARAMYNALGLGWGNSLLGFIAIAFGIPAPFVLWKYGETLRARSKFARE